MKLIKGNPKSLHQNTLIGVFLLAVVSSLGSLVYFSTHNEISLKLKPENYFTLYEAFKAEGFQGFLERKKVLKAQVNETLKQPASEEEEETASNIALYLFPEVLPDSNFEKSVAMEEWAPLQAAIEKAPRTSEARLWFEEMRANIWNYENPKLQNSTISPYAKEALKIYNELSAP